MYHTLDTIRQSNFRVRTDDGPTELTNKIKVSLARQGRMNESKDVKIFILPAEYDTDPKACRHLEALMDKLKDMNLECEWTHCKENDRATSLSYAIMPHMPDSELDMRAFRLKLLDATLKLCNVNASSNIWQSNVSHTNATGFIQVDSLADVDTLVAASAGDPIITTDKATVESKYNIIFSPMRSQILPTSCTTIAAFIGDDRNFNMDKYTAKVNAAMEAYNQSVDIVDQSSVQNFRLTQDEDYLVTRDLNIEGNALPSPPPIQELQPCKYSKKRSRNEMEKELFSGPTQTEKNKLLVQKRMIELKLKRQGGLNSKISNPTVNKLRSELKNVDEKIKGNSISHNSGLSSSTINNNNFTANSIPAVPVPNQNPSGTGGQNNIDHHDGDIIRPQSKASALNPVKLENIVNLILRMEPSIFILTGITILHGIPDLRTRRLKTRYNLFSTPPGNGNDAPGTSAGVILAIPSCRSNHSVNKEYVHHLLPFTMNIPEVANR
ncbi:hypothetical protein L486_06620 [Kwoniella mangroviensis CBS 10435]|uniref:Uncharacterized protein n=1 Tax=Kwoniella mangroviensis CBS 10435 TaxID=1331196 RepID=A0A1B9IJY3_9TREE|nr:hypothetical protein L486_06620 [Kwoniella mangroviensis CBS 10435]